MLAAASGGDNGTYGFFVNEEWASTIEVVNGRMPGLTHAVGYLSYQVRGPRGCMFSTHVPTVNYIKFANYIKSVEGNAHCR